jgi:hypothetical protein
MKRHHVPKELFTALLLYGLTREQQNEIMSILKQLGKCLKLSHSDLVDQIMHKGRLGKEER